MQIRALVRLGDLDAFWEAVEGAMRTQIGDYIQQIDLPDSYDPLTVDQTGVLGLVELKRVRTALPALEPKFQGLSARQKASVMRHRPGPYMAGHVADILKAAKSWRAAESTAQQTVSTCAPYVTSEQLGDILSAWAENYECRTASGMLELAVEFFSLVPAPLRKDKAWQTFLDSVREHEEADSPFRYDELEQAMLAVSSSSK